MLIDENIVTNWLNKFNINVKGVFHVGAHDCEELSFYTRQLNISPEQCVWVEAIKEKVVRAKDLGIPNIYQAVVTDTDDSEVTFNVSNNIQSSSVLPFGTHSINHSWVHYTHSLTLPTITIDTFFKRNNISPTNFTFWNFDIQGAELLALKGAKEALQYPSAIYLEVNTEEVYKGCGLLHEIDILLAQYRFIRVETKMTTAGWGDALYIKIV